MNYFACSYNVSEDKEVFPIVTVGEPDYLVNAEGDEYVDYPASTFKGKTNAGKSIEIVIDVDHSAKVMVDGVQQVHMKNVMCSYGLAG